MDGGDVQNFLMTLLVASVWFFAGWFWHRALVARKRSREAKANLLALEAAEKEAARVLTEWEK